MWMRMGRVGLDRGSYWKNGILGLLGGRYGPGRPGFRWSGWVDGRTRVRKGKEYLGVDVDHNIIASVCHCLGVGVLRISESSYG